MDLSGNFDNIHKKKMSPLRGFISRFFNFLPRFHRSAINRHLISVRYKVVSKKIFQIRPTTLVGENKSIPA